MNRWEKEVQQSLLDSEAAVMKALKSQYEQALKDIDEKLKQFQTDIDLLDQALSQDGLDDAAKQQLQSQKRSKIYQKQYQQALKSQVSAIVDKLHSDSYTIIDKYLKSCYEDSFIGTMYDIAKQGIPIIVPIDQTAVVRAILTDSKIVEGYYKRLGVHYGKLKTTITQEVSRGIATSLSYNDIARNIDNVAKTGLYNAQRIARTESHRIKSAASYQAALESKARGADIVKQWDAALDSRTRLSHAKVDGEVKELEETFSNGLLYPGDPSGSAAEVINCRCVALTRARWALDESELQELKERAEFFGLDKTESFEEFREKYLKAAENEKQFGVAYGKDAVDVNLDHINSKAYKDKFSQITDNPKANASIYDVSRTMLSHCDGTEHEDMYLLDMNGAIISKVTDSVSRLGINYTDDFKKALENIATNGTPTIAIHNHPHGTPPSPDDFRKAFENKYSVGVIVGHNGQVYVYANNSVEISIEQADQIANDIEFFYKSGWDIDRASQEVYNVYGLSYTVIKEG